MTFELHSLII